jgi:hypothetical protein
MSHDEELRGMKRIMTTGLVALGLTLAVPGAAWAQSGHFVGTQVCRDTGLSVTCTGKVAGLGSTTFEIVVIADGRASVECRNPAGQVAPGQSFEYEAEGTTGTLRTPRNGQYRYSVSTDVPTPPAGSCPNRKWTATVTDVAFSGDATVELRESGTVSDSVTVPIS